MKILLIIILSLTVGLSFGQADTTSSVGKIKDLKKVNKYTTITHLDDSIMIAVHPTGLYWTIPKPDTIQTISFCIDTATLETKWRKLYGIRGYGMTPLYAYGFWMYKQYLMPDRKTPCTYKVIYSLDQK